MQYGRQLDFPYKIMIGTGAFFITSYFIDTGTSIQKFINTSFTKRHRLATVALTKPYNLKLANGELVEQITYITKINFKIDTHYNEL